MNITYFRLYLILFVLCRRDRKKSRSPRRSRSPRNKRKSPERKPEEVPFDPTNPDKVKLIKSCSCLKNFKIYFSQHYFFCDFNWNIFLTDCLMAVRPN